MADVEDLGQALRDVVEELRVVHPNRQIDSRIDIEVGVRCDRSRIQQLASNLLSNALTHGGVATPVVFSAHSHVGELVLTVQNQGEPIALENLPQVFKPFWRGSSSSPRSGLGLGLFICSEIVKAHGGTLEVTSTAHAGTIFGARLPSLQASDDSALRASKMGET
jgi:signal transduction histidine kinase